MTSSNYSVAFAIHRAPRTARVALRHSQRNNGGVICACMYRFHFSQSEILRGSRSSIARKDKTANRKRVINCDIENELGGGVTFARCNEADGLFDEAMHEDEYCAKMIKGRARYSHLSEKIAILEGTFVFNFSSNRYTCIHYHFYSDNFEQLMLNSQRLPL